MGSLSDNERDLISLQEEEEQRAPGNTAMLASNAPKEVTEQIARQIKYRRARELSMSRDQPPRLPCRPWYNNGNERMYIHVGETEREYHQKRLKYYEIDYPAFHGDDCLTCMDHRKCNDHLCKARRVSCYYCNTKEGPLLVRAKKLAKRIAERPKRFDK